MYDSEARKEMAEFLRLVWVVRVCGSHFARLRFVSLQRRWIYVGGFWLIDIHSVDIIYNGIQFALNHSPNASESTRMKGKTTQRGREMWKRNKKIPQRSQFVSFQPFFSFSFCVPLSPYFFPRFIVPQQPEPVSQHNAHRRKKRI